jgi:hypothetical protein
VAEDYQALRAELRSTERGDEESPAGTVVFLVI